MALRVVLVLFSRRHVMFLRVLNWGGSGLYGRGGSKGN